MSSYKTFRCLIVIFIFTCIILAQSELVEKKKSSFAPFHNTDPKINNVDSSFVTYTHLRYQLGILTDKEYEFYEYPKISRHDIILNVNYRISNYYEPINDSIVQFGFVNEFGLHWKRPYVKIGPEIRAFGDYYVSLNFGLSLFPTSGYVGFDTQWGGNLGYTKEISGNYSLNIEWGVDNFIFRESSFVSYLTLGLLVNM